MAGRENLPENLPEELNEARTLAQQIEFYEALADAQAEMGLGVVVVDGHSEKPIYVNAVLLSILGFTREEFLSMKSIYSLVAPEIRDRLKVLGALRIADAVWTDHYKLVALRKDGSRVELEMAVKKIEGTEGKSIALIREISLHDLDDSTVDQAPTPYVSSVLDNDGNILFLCPLFKAQAGLKESTPIGKSFADLIVENERVEFIDLLQASRATPFPQRGRFSLLGAAPDKLDFLFTFHTLGAEKGFVLSGRITPKSPKTESV